MTYRTPAPRQEDNHQVMAPSEDSLEELRLAFERRRRRRAAVLLVGRFVRRATAIAAAVVVAYAVLP